MTESFHARSVRTGAVAGHGAAEGWTAFAEGRGDDASSALRQSAELEDESGTHPVTPGQILPAREQLGDLLLELGRPLHRLLAQDRRQLRRQVGLSPSFHHHVRHASPAARRGRDPQVASLVAGLGQALFEWVVG